MQTVWPYLLYEDGNAAIEFLVSAFGFTEVMRATGAAGGLHAELGLPGSDARIYLGQPPSDSHDARAKAVGAPIEP